MENLSDTNLIEKVCKYIWDVCVGTFSIFLFINLIKFILIESLIDYMEKDSIRYVKYRISRTEYKDSNHIDLILSYIHFLSDRSFFLRDRLLDEISLIENDPITKYHVFLMTHCHRIYGIYYFDIIKIDKRKKYIELNVWQNSPRIEVGKIYVPTDYFSDYDLIRVFYMQILKKEVLKLEYLDKNPYEQDPDLIKFYLFDADINSFLSSKIEEIYKSNKTIHYMEDGYLSFNHIEKFFLSTQATDVRDSNFLRVKIKKIKDKNSNLHSIQIVEESKISKYINNGDCVRVSIDDRSEIFEYKSPFLFSTGMGKIDHTNI